MPMAWILLHELAAFTEGFDRLLLTSRYDSLCPEAFPVLDVTTFIFLAGSC